MSKKRKIAAVSFGVCASLVLLPSAAQAGDGQLGKSTLDQTIKESGKGFKKLVPGPGEPYQVRKNFNKAKKKRADRRRSLMFFGQLTDSQVADEMSPARLELTDPASGLISAAWRPHEALGVRVFDSVIRNMNANRTSRVRQGNGKRAKLQYTLLTGDVADSQQINEVTWFRKILDGKRLDPYSGKLDSANNPCPSASAADIARNDKEVTERRYVGVQDFTDWPGQDLRYAGFWDPNIGGSDNEYGYGDFPKYPGLMDKAQTKMKAEGLKVPWYITRGNHDTLVQGNVPANMEIGGLLSIGEVAVGCQKPWPNNKLNPDPLKGLSGDEIFEELANNQLGGLLEGLFHMRPVAPDPDRRYVSKLGFKDAVGKTDNQHGFGYVSKAEKKRSNQNASYYAFNRGKFRIIMLDTNSEGGNAAGNLDNPQYKWLQRQLDRYSTVEINKKGKIKRDKGRNKMLIISSHHTLGTMNSTVADEEAGTCTDANTAGCDSDPRNSKPLHLGKTGKAAVLPLLLRYPNVVAYVNGHTHHNKVTSYKRKGAQGSKFRGGFWEINTSSHVDWPQQSRTIELMDNMDGSLSVFGTVLDSAAPIKPPKPGAKAKDMTNAELASLSRRLAINDPQRVDVTEGGGAGKLNDRNVELLVKDPRELWRGRG